MLNAESRKRKFYRFKARLCLAFYFLLCLLIKLTSAYATSCPLPFTLQYLILRRNFIIDYFLLKILSENFLLYKYRKYLHQNLLYSANTYLSYYDTQFLTMISLINLKRKISIVTATPKNISLTIKLLSIVTIR